MKGDSLCFVAYLRFGRKNEELDYAKQFIE